MTGETMHQEAVEPDEDYLDPHYLHTAAEIYEMPVQEVEYEYGQNIDPFAGESWEIFHFQGLIENEKCTLS